ncbi:D-glycero-beta-D-manno-heptose 1,7-bisphosphate 7-phosphatase [Marinobacter hydrocarbonoclasticus]|nr:D-glycero-beta-D-manno-heptose 1,7-bisphosphate 7-phosphatase [Marinobacter nauticus]
MHPAVFLDRDGVINRDHGYVGSIDAFEFLPGVLQACAQLVNAGYRLVVVTNQSGIARGYYGETEFHILTEWMKTQFEEAGAPLAGVYYCPHHPDKGEPPYRTDCECRKPMPGMLLRACEELNLDSASSYIVGDKYSDMAAGRRAGLKATLLVGDSESKSGKEPGQYCDWHGDDLGKAVGWILAKTPILDK